mgnify:CR=1 FL=1
MNGFGNQKKSKEYTNNKINKSKEQIISQAFSFHAQGKLEEARKCYQNLISQGLKNHMVFTNLAIILQSLGKYEEAEILLRKAIELKPNLAEAHFNLGNVLTKLGRIKEAELPTRKAIELKPNFVEAHANLGSILSNQKRLEEAVLSTRKAIELKSDYINAFLNLGEILKKQKKLQEAESTFLKAIELNPKFGQSYFQLSKLYSKQNEYIKAYKYINLAIKYDPKNHLIQGEFTRLNFLLGMFRDEKYEESDSVPWSNSDDYFYEDNDSDTLLISFGSNGRSENLIPSFNFYNLLKNNKSFDKLFLRDIDRNYYLTGLKNSTNNLQETIDLIKKLSSVKRYRKIVSIGSSAGGFAAILFGQLINFTKVVAFNPQTVISKEKETILYDFFYTVEKCKELRNLNTSDSLYQKCLNLKNLIPFKTNVDIHFSNLSREDKQHAEFIEHQNCKLIKYNSSSHLLAVQLRESKKLISIIEENLD